MSRRYELTDIVSADELSIELQYPEIYRDLADFTRGSTMEVLHENGLYRHLRFKSSYENSHIPLGAFDVITWPQFITLEGPMVGAITFSRLPDMIEFFINYGVPLGQLGGLSPLARIQHPKYLLEKAIPRVDGGTPDSFFSFDSVKRSVDAAITKWIAAHPGIDGDSVRRRLEEIYRGSIEHDVPGLREEILYLNRSNKNRLLTAESFICRLLGEIESEFRPDLDPEDYGSEVSLSRPRSSEFVDEISYEHLLACYLLTWACDSYASAQSL